MRRVLFTFVALACLSSPAAALCPAGQSCESGRGPDTRTIREQLRDPAPPLVRGLRQPARPAMADPYYGLTPEREREGGRIDPVDPEERRSVLDDELPRLEWPARRGPGSQPYPYGN
jgi:hypothetical protein